jgi:hypothetical protein
MSQRNFGQNKGSSDNQGWQGVPDWGSPSQNQGNQFHQNNQGGDSDWVGDLENHNFEQDRPAHKRNFNQGQQQFEQPFQNSYQQDQGQGFYQNQQGYQQNYQQAPYQDFQQDSYDAKKEKKHWSKFSIILTVVVVALLILGTMVFFKSKAQKAPNAGLETSAKTEKTIKSSDDRIFPDGGADSKKAKSESKKEEAPKKEQSTESLDGAKEVTNNTEVKTIDDKAVSSELLVAKGTVKSVHLVAGSDLVASYQAEFSVGSTSIKTVISMDLASQLKVGDVVTVKYRKVADVDKVVVDSIFK